ncbi:MAG: phosphate-starvation-inducible E-like protein [Pseudomonadales bacterium]|nr:phosphate-starvation-inducible PsiE family protein [Pseudomonadales bacterium]NIX08417.1 phosphate-starvation-inducible E-like protein [Pseudomonadales bacterium]
MMKLIENIERWVVLGLLVLMLLVVVASSVELAIVIAEAALQNRLAEEPGYLILDINELLGIFGFFLLVLIGLELLASVKMYLEDDIVHVELVMLIALIAVSRKIIVIDYEKIDGLTVVGIAALVLVLSVGYYLMKRSHEES